MRPCPERTSALRSITTTTPSGSAWRARTTSGSGRSARSRSRRRSTTAPTARKGRPVLRTHLRPGEGLGVPLRQVPRHEVQGHDLRPLRRQGHAQPASAASGWATSSWPRRSCTSGSSRRMPSRLGTPAGHEDDATWRRIIYFQDYVVVDPGDTPLKRTQLLTEDEYRKAREKYGDAASRPRWAPRRSRSCSSSSTSWSCRSSSRERAEDGAARQAEAAGPRQAAEDRRGLPAIRDNKPEWMVLDVHPGHPAGPAPAGAARQRQLRHQRPERPLSPHHQPQQPAQEAGRPQRARSHHPQREADAAAGGRRAVRQQPLRPRPCSGRATARSSR